MFELYSICESAQTFPSGPGTRPVAPRFGRSDQVRPGRRTDSRAAGSDRMGAVARAARSDVALAERRTALVDGPPRVLRQRRDPNRSAPLPLGRNEADRTPRAPARVLPVHSGRLGLFRTLWRRAAADPTGKGVLRCCPIPAPLLPAQGIAGMDVRLGWAVPPLPGPPHREPGGDQRAGGDDGARQSPRGGGSAAGARRIPEGLPRPPRRGDRAVRVGRGP